MADTMKALVKTKGEKGLWMQEVPVPKIAPNEVLIKIERTAICGTCLLYTSPSPRDRQKSRMPSSA